MREKLRGLRRHEAMLEEGGKFCGVAAAMVASAAVGAGASMYSSSQNKKAAQAGSTRTNSLDPRIENQLFGSNGDNGLLSFFESFKNQPQSAAMQSYGNTSNNYLQNYTGADTDTIRNVGHSMIQQASNAAPQSQGLAKPYGTGGVAQIGTPTVEAPSQNNMNLSGAFDRFINGDAGANPYLLKGQQAAIDATNAGFQKNQTDLTNNLLRNVLPSIRGGAIAAGQYGGSRQGIVEANALSDYTNQLTSANTQLGLANSANTTAQQAAAFNQGQDRSLSATLNLSGQQYNTASQNAGLALQAMMANQAADNRAREYNATAATNADLANMQNNQFNVNAQLQNRNQNNASMATGAGLLSGGLSTALAGATGAQNYNLNQAQAVSGLLSPFIGVNGSSTTTQPYYGNSSTSALGGAMSGLSLYDQFSRMGSGSSYNAQDIRNSYGAGMGTGYNTFDVSAGMAPVNNSIYGMWGG